MIGDSWLSKKASFLLRAAMACLFTCFRFNEEHHHSTSSSSSSRIPSTTPEVGAKKRSSLSSLMLSEEEERGGSRFKEKENKGVETTLESGFDVKELKDEARFLKDCGTIPETPTEIRNFSKEDKSREKGEFEYSKFRSWLGDTTYEKLNLANQPDQPPTSVKKPEELVNGTVSLEQTPSSCMTQGDNSRRISTSSAEDSGILNVNTPGEVHATQGYSLATSSVSSGDLAPSVHGRNRSVRFDCKSGLSSVSSESFSSENQNFKNFDAAGYCSMSNPSPYPTPLKLSDEMQTPGTAFPAYLDNIANGKNTRIRSQYVYPASNPVENFSQWKVLKDEDSESNQSSGQAGTSLGQVDVRSSLEKDTRDTEVEKELEEEGSLSSWLKPVTNHERNNYSTVRRRSINPGDRPILGMVAAHWNEEEPLRVSPKWWDGNGIPNSTNKYKEDQKVSWHATPFEERLEKALSEETVISQRKQITGTPPIDFGESEESDTALSKFQSSTNLNKSIASC